MEFVVWARVPMPDSRSSGRNCDEARSGPRPQQRRVFSFQWSVRQTSLLDPHGVALHILVDTLGLLIAIVISVARSRGSTTCVRRRARGESTRNHLGSGWRLGDYCRVDDSANSAASAGPAANTKPPSPALPHPHHAPPPQSASPHDHSTTSPRSSWNDSSSFDGASSGWKADRRVH